MWDTYLQPTSVAETLDLLQRYGGQARIVAGGTDVLVELSREAAELRSSRARRARGGRPTATLIDVTRLPDLKYVRDDGRCVRLGALATHNDVLASPSCVQGALPLAQACREVGAPQIRTRATVAGNLVTASPANDTITPLLALGAEVVLASAAGRSRAQHGAPKGRWRERVVGLSDFCLGVRRTVARPDELLREIRVPRMAPEQRGLFLKLGLRRAQAISVINVALVLAFDGDRVREARIALGAVAPTVVRAAAAEAYLEGRRLDAAVCEEAGRLVGEGIAPIDDVRGSASYRRATAAALVADGLRRLADGLERDGWMTPAAWAPPTRAHSARSGPVLLDTGGAEIHGTAFDGVIRTTINGRGYELPGAQNKTLLNALREDAGLTGTKEGCAEGECGACTVWLNGQAVMACLVPAPQAHNAVLTTIEGLAGDSAGLHPLQRAFIERGAVQCGYCIPGMLMAGAKLLQERPRPDLEEIRVALSGNLCRCTGYRKILDAVLAAGGAL
jgi:carbon-monoxide dehydrogenase medium subunit